MTWVNDVPEREESGAARETSLRYRNPSLALDLRNPQRDLTTHQGLDHVIPATRDARQGEQRAMLMVNRLLDDGGEIVGGSIGDIGVSLVDPVKEQTVSQTPSLDPSRLTVLCKSPRSNPPPGAPKDKGQTTWQQNHHDRPPSSTARARSDEPRTVQRGAPARAWNTAARANQLLLTCSAGDLTSGNRRPSTSSIESYQHRRAPRSQASSFFGASGSGARVSRLIHLLNLIRREVERKSSVEG